MNQNTNYKVSLSDSSNLKQKIINSLPFLVLATNLGFWYSVVVILYNSYGQDAGWLFWLCGLGGSFLIMFIMKRWFERRNIKVNNEATD